MRQLGWLHAVPQGSKKSRMVAFKESADDDSVFLQFPDLEGAAYLVTLVHEAGTMQSNGMGAVPLSWQEIDAWLNVTELRLTIWEKLTIREMSEAYVAEFVKASDKHAVAPYQGAVDASRIDRKAVADKLRNVLRGFKKGKPKEDA